MENNTNTVETKEKATSDIGFTPKDIFDQITALQKELAEKHTLYRMGEALAYVFENAEYDDDDARNEAVESVTAVFAARVMELLGYEVEPSSDSVRHDIIQMIHMKKPDALKKFCLGIQMGAPVDSYVTPEPWDMPGYDNQVIMAAGAFIQGASIELSADAPMREPYTVYLQGGLTYESGKTGVLLAVEQLLKD